MSGERVLYDEDGLVCALLPGGGASEALEAAADLLWVRRLSGRATFLGGLFLPEPAEGGLVEEFSAAHDGGTAAARVEVSLPGAPDGGVLLLLVALAGCLPTFDELFEERRPGRLLALRGDASWLAEAGLGAADLAASLDFLSRVRVAGEVDGDAFEGSPVASFSLSGDGASMDVVLDFPSLSAILGLDAPFLSEFADGLAAAGLARDQRLLALACALGEALPAEEGENADEFSLGRLRALLGLGEDADCGFLDGLLRTLGALPDWRAERFQEIVDQEEGGERVRRGETVWRVARFA